MEPHCPSDKAQSGTCPPAGDDPCVHARRVGPEKGNSVSSGENLVTI